MLHILHFKWVISSVTNISISIVTNIKKNRTVNDLLNICTQQAAVLDLNAGCHQSLDGKKR